MGYATMLLHLQAGVSNSALLRFAGNLIAQCPARVIGIAARQPMTVIYAEAYVPETVIDQDRQEMTAELRAAETEFRASFGADAEWRSVLTQQPLAAILAREARCADLVITGTDRQNSLFEAARYVDAGELVMEAGRPCLIVPRDAEAMPLNHVVVAWKDTVEARRAVAAALPILALARKVTVVEFARADEQDEAQARVADVCAYLAAHRIAAQAVSDVLNDDLRQLDTFLSDRQADLVVAGAYGHSRVREWALGGVTRDLLLRGERCALITH